MKNILIVFLLMSFAFAKAQSVNNYKYVIVDNQYEFQAASNQYQLNGLMVFLLNKYGFTALSNNEVVPVDMNRGLCNTLYVEVVKSGFLSINLDYQLKDCEGNIILELPRGSSNIKDFQKAYFEATREAFQFLDSLNYAYQGPFVKESNVITSTVDVVETMVNEPEVKVAVVDSINKESSEQKRYDYQEKSDTPFALKFDETKSSFELYRFGAKVGSGRKSAAGVFLVTSASFTGIGFMEDDSFILEYDEAGQLRRIKLERVD